MCLVPINLVVAQSDDQQDIGIIINEFLPNPDGADTDLEWIEIFNPTEKKIELGNYSFKVNGKQIYQFEVETQAPPGTYLVANLPKSPLPNCSSQPCEIKLELVNGEKIIDTVTYSQTIAGKTWSRMKDGTWTLDYELTPGKENKAKEIIKTLQISEVYAAPNSGESERVEIVNFGEQQIDLADWNISDKTGKHKLSGIVPAKSHFVIEDLSISLNNSDELLSLLAPDGTKVDEFAYSSSVKGTSLIRLGNKIVNTITVTPGAENIFTQIEERRVELDPIKEIEKPSVLGVSKPLAPPINYTMPSDKAYYQPLFIGTNVIEFTTTGLSIYLFGLALMLLWKQGYIERYYQWWSSG